MNYSRNVVLAIAPGKRELGVAVFSGARLLDASIKTIRNQKSKKSLSKEIAGIMEKLFQDFPIRIVVIKAISQYQRLSPDLESIVACIKFESEREGLQITNITIEQIKSELCEDEKATEKRAFKALLASYPELKRYWNRPNKWQKDYYAFLFSAVAVGVVYLKTINKSD